MSEPTHVSQSVVVGGVTPHDVFEHLTDPANHVSEAGDMAVRGPTGATRLAAKGDRFGMRMAWHGIPYRVVNTVVEFEPDRRIAWRHFAGHRWRYELADVDGGTEVTETFDMSRIPGPSQAIYRTLFGFPDGYRRNLRTSLDDLADRLGG